VSHSTHMGMIFQGAVVVDGIIIFIFLIDCYCFFDERALEMKFKRKLNRLFHYFWYCYDIFEGFHAQFPPVLKAIDFQISPNYDLPPLIFLEI